MKENIESFIYEKVKNKKSLKKILSFLYRNLFTEPRKVRKANAYKQNAATVLKSANKALTNNNIAFWLDFGTMLGAYRERGFISHDIDIDISVFYIDKDKVELAMNSEGFKMKHQFLIKEDGLEQTYTLNNVSIDIFFYKEKNENEIYCNTFSLLDNIYYGKTNFDYPALVKEVSIPFAGFKQIDFLGDLYNVPVNIEECLIAHYGLEFMKPDPNFDYKKEAKNIKYYTITQKQGVFRKFIN